MKFADFMCTEAIRADLKAEDKEGVIREMTHALLDAGQILEDDYKSIVKTLLRREELGSTATGRGVALPHAKHPSVDRTIGAAAVSPKGADFSSLDGEPVHFFFLLLSPSDPPDDHLRALETISRSLRNDGFCRFLTGAKSVEEIRQLLDESDGNQFS